MNVKLTLKRLARCYGSISFCATLFILYAQFAFHTFAEELYVKLRVQGSAIGPTHSVRQLAIEQAKRNAIEQYLFSILPEEFVDKVGHIFQQKEPYIVSTTILQEHTTTDACSVEMEVEIQNELIDTDVVNFLINQIQELPSISLLVVGEKMEGTQLDTVEESMKIMGEKLAQRKFKVIRYEDMLKIMPEREIFNLVSCSLEEKRKVALAQESDIFVLGRNQYHVFDVLGDDKLKRCRCTLTVEIYRVDDGKLLDAYTCSSSVQAKNIEEGNRIAGEDSALKAIPKIITTSFLGYVNFLRQNDYLYIYVDGFEDLKLVEKIGNLIEIATGGSTLEWLTTSSKRSKARVKYDGPLVYVVDTISHHPELRDKVTIYKALDRRIYLRFLN